MRAKELYQKYLNREGLRKLSFVTFRNYLSKYGGSKDPKAYGDLIRALGEKKKTGNINKGVFKVTNIKEVVKYAEIYGIKKAAERYNISTRSVYRYKDTYS